jgi:hypothetical protein
LDRKGKKRREKSTDIYVELKRRGERRSTDIYIELER